jgi:hypothetical protein
VGKTKTALVVLIVLAFRSAGPAFGGTCTVFEEEKSTTVQGQIVQSATTVVGEGGEKPHKFMAIVLDSAICFKNDSETKIRFIATGPISARWLGHYVSVTGNMTASGEGWFLRVREIGDVK